MLEDAFHTLGFTKNEAKVYLTLADMGRSAAQLVAKRAGIPRTTAYSVLQSLLNRGVISVEQQKGATYYTVNSPASLLRMVQREKEAVLAREAAAKTLSEQIRPYFKNRNFSIPRIQFYDGRANVESMLYDNYPKWHESLLADDSTWWGYQDHSFVEQYSEWLRYTWNLKKDDEKIHLISNEASVEQELKGKVSNRIILPVPEEFNFSSTIWVVGNFIVLLTTAQHPHYAFQLEDAVFASNLRSVFKMLWFATNLTPTC